MHKSCANVSDRRSTDDWVYLLDAGPLPEMSDTSVNMAIQWRDQGRGNQKGLIRAVLHRGDTAVAEVDCFGVAPHAQAFAHKAIRDIGNVVLVSGDTIKFYYRVGGGGGHELHITSFEVACEKVRGLSNTAGASASSGGSATAAASSRSVEAFDEQSAASGMAVDVADDSAATCAVCLEVEPRVKMPCCGRDGSTVGYCRRCIEIICEQAQGVGKCPSCRAYISTDGAGGVKVTEAVAQCRMCCQRKVIINDGQCDACLLGSRYPLPYECSECHQIQRISHPMWRYQESLGSFGTASWACHCRCNSQTHWRLVASEAHRVPDFDAPESWGRREEWLAGVRAQRRREIGRAPETGMAAAGPHSRGAPALRPRSPSTSQGCTVS